MMLAILLAFIATDDIKPESPPTYTCNVFGCRKDEPLQPLLKDEP